MDVTTLQTVQAVLDGTFEGGVVVGTLENTGVDLAPFHELDSMVSDELKAELEDLRAGIIDGSIQTSP
jgi:basic membrane protein A